MLNVESPPVLVAAGNAVHGVVRDVDVFQLPDLWAFHLYSYAAELLIDGVSYQIRPGAVSLVPPGAVTEYRYRGPSRHRYVHFSAPADADPEHGPGAPLVVPLGPEYPAIDENFRLAVANAILRPERSAAEIWIALHRVLDRAVSAGAPANDPVDHVAQALSIIEARLQDRLTVAGIAAEVGISHTHLTRLFRAETGRTVIGYVRHRRIERAVHLLRHTTMPIAAVAATVGFDDPQAFNKSCRVESGLSPRGVRAGVAPDAATPAPPGSSPS
ncbi:Transcriptional regulator, AraC family OS=Tsukamurella paurometabola (strain ATCC 8368 / DSM/ CCUG 35730 / CIP 100753 / JCM 10117 / KCTC 9821 / NBRC 16120/ NCIMB 702349 / NCTC 13040) OX=521096 GN=Tpau_0975 PE=4 SV=1 [Tsukamurella paurometabola]|uniref:Transcriptional regulator, AraC family n=1 Tax=Tsukamurella paurometabola (strain ATCC 8368 / DSM 20162 / CCUG 35730 / CIP 100753 / JCM 10117 / KCTC 9821 / NBRC 16120 / NCIMB 702349 / NCTC 13040) TaxID=521096 RepID=D5UUN7_TSUPD|nr:AraC family transcriptional regulator [Tsukamurella paurometabola]ADG77608.1 transcriptional regulator, AraC family [Tsukamurella paurometabola DSM 20162]SUP27912.1 Arabinose operon regulatory protein [Tsukamurella paurometabola]